MSTIRARCKAADVAVLASRDLGRLLRIVARANRGGLSWDPAADLETCDPRTLRRLLLGGGLADWPVRAAPPSVEQLLQRQRFVHDRAVASLRREATVRMPMVPIRVDAGNDVPPVEPSAYARTRRVTSR